MKKKLCLPLLCLLSMLLWGCSGAGQQEAEWEKVQEKAITFSDGAYVDLWRLDSRDTRAYYKLSDGTDLLLVRPSSGPENVYNGGVDCSFNDLSETAQEAVKAYYEEQGILYDIPSSLQKAYESYLNAQEAGYDFRGFVLEQTISPVSANEKIICFGTYITGPITGGTLGQTSLYAVFDRETGEYISTWDLFAVPEAEARKVLIDFYLDAYDASASRAELESALQPEYIALESGGLSVQLPAGSLPGQEDAAGMGIDYTDLEGILQDWAVPDSQS